MHTAPNGTKSAFGPQSSGAVICPSTQEASGGWYCVWTRSHCEDLVHDQLTTQGLEVFLPKTMMWRRRGGRRTLAETILFPGYLFVRHPMDKATQIAILKTRGVVRLLGERWDRLSPIPDDELAAVRRMVTACSRVRRHGPAFDEGTPVRILNGPLEGLRGTFVADRPDKGRFLVSVSLLQRSVSVEVDAHMVEPLR